MPNKGGGGENEFCAFIPKKYEHLKEIIIIS
jgi:hypothetical protein